MDWFSWFSKTDLEPSIAHEYALAFANNQLEEKDIAYLNHEFLQSMGIYVAKHRLEILKLVRKEKEETAHSMSGLLVKIRQTRRCLAKYIRRWIHREDHSALACTPKHNFNSRWKEAMFKRNKGVVRPKQGRLKHTDRSHSAVLPAQEMLMLTNGSPMVVSTHSSPMINSFSGPLFHERITNGSPLVVSGQERLLLTYGSPMLASSPMVNSFSGPLFHDLSKAENREAVVDNGFFPMEREEIRWHAMFQNLKPT